MDTRLHWIVPCLLSSAAPVWAADPGNPPQQAAEVVVTATALRESPLETAQPTTVVGGDDLVRLRALSLGETLAAQPGISATYFGPQASRPVIRGLGGDRVQMYEDGGDALDVSALSNDHSVTIDPLVAQRVEVVRGPATLLYGNGASGGLINVLTNRIPTRIPNEPVTGAFELRGDSALEERAVAGRLDGGSGMWAWHADTHGRKTDDVRIPGFALSHRLRDQLTAAGEDVNEMRDRLGNTGSDTYGGSVGGSFIGNHALAGLAFSRFDTVYGIADSGGEEGVSIDLRQKRYDLNTEITRPDATINSVRLRAGYNDYRHAELDQDGAIGTLFEQHGLDARLTFDHAPLGGWRGTAGAQLRDVDLHVAGEEALVPPSDTRNTGFFLFEERPFGAVTAELGARLEQQDVDVDDATGLPDYDRSSVSGSVGALWKVTPDYAVALNITSTQRHPTATELFANGPHIAAQRFEIGDPTLRREYARTTDLGFRKTAGAWRGSLTAFHSDYSRYIFTRFTGEVAQDEEESLPIVQFQQTDAHFTGFEADLSLPPVDVPLGTFSTRFVADYVRAKLRDGGDLPQIPPLRLGGEVAFERNQLVSTLSVTYYDKQDRVAENELPTDAYTLVDFDVSYRMPAASTSMLFFLRGQNLLDEEARRNTSPLKDLAPLPGRGAAAGVRLEF